MDITGDFGMMRMMFYPMHPFFMALYWLVLIGWAVFLVWAIHDVSKAKYDATTKIFWLLVITMAGNLRYSLLGIILYSFFGRKKKS